MTISPKNATLLATGVLCQLVACANEKTQVEDFFPPEIEALEVRRAPLEPEKREYLQTFDVSDTTLDLYGDVFVKGYKSENFRWGDLKPDDLGPLKPEYDSTGIRQFASLPGPGVHPRMFFTDADRAAHQHRLEKTKGGKEGMKILMSYTELLKGTFDKDADYAQPDIYNGSFSTHGFLPLFRAGGDLDTNRQIWEAYTTGQTPNTGKYNNLNIGLCALEAFRCWLYEDAEGAKELGTAVETALREKLAELKPGERLGGTYFSYNLMYVYDFIYNWLTEEQRTFFHSLIITANFDNTQYGVFQDPLNTTSNWSTFSYRIFSWLGLEGDPGYNKLQYKGYVRGMTNYLNYGWFPAGPCFEAFGKNQLGGEIIYTMAMRGDNLAAHPHLQATLRDYLPHAIVPWRDEYIAYDRLGGIRNLNGNDILPLKNLFPDDKHVDWVYRNTVKEGYTWKEGDDIRVEGYFNNALFSVLWTVDYDEANNDPGKLMETESFIGPQRGLAITRSDWSTDALYLHHHVRGATGGHVFADRSSIVLGGRGRIWIPNPHIGYKTRENNVVDVDGINLVAAAPARMADYKRTPLATFSTADLLPTWNYTYDRLDEGSGKYKLADVAAGTIPMREGWEANPTTINDYALQPVDSPQFTTSLFEQQHWLEPGAITASIRKPSKLQFKKAFRTTGMVRTSKDIKGEPYALVIDDYETVDDGVHTYDWLARIAPDLAIIKVEKWTLNKEGKRTTKIEANDRVFYDVLLAPQNDVILDRYGRMDIGSKTPALLVRVLQMNSDAEIEQPVEGPISMTFVERGKQLMVRTLSKDPKFKVMLFPYIHGSFRLPETTWNDDGTVLTIKIRDQIDHITFTEQTAGPTLFELTRENAPDGANIFSYQGNEYNSAK